MEEIDTKYTWNEYVLDPVPIMEIKVAKHANLRWCMI